MIEITYKACRHCDGTSHRVIDGARLCLHCHAEWEPYTTSEWVDEPEDDDCEDYTSDPYIYSDDEYGDVADEVANSIPLPL